MINAKELNNKIQQQVLDNYREDLESFYSDIEKMIKTASDNYKTSTEMTYGGGYGRANMLGDNAIGREI